MTSTHFFNLEFLERGAELEVCFLILSVAFGRISLKSQKEKLLSACLQASVLGGIAWWAYDAEDDMSKLAVLLACECVSYLFLSRGWPLLHTVAFTLSMITTLLKPDLRQIAVAFMGGLIVYQGGLGASAAVAFGAAFWPLAHRMLPFDELTSAYKALDSVFANEHKEEFAARSFFLVLTAIHVQLGVGQLGVSYLRASQRRKNALLTQVATGNMKAKCYAKKMVLPFILTVALPYLGQRVAIEACYELAFQRFAFRAQRALRLETLMPSRLTALLSSSSTTQALTLEAYGSAVEATAKRIYDLGSRKLFSLPKIALLPSLARQHPVVFIWSLPACLAVDAIKARLIAALTRRVEEARRRATQAKSQRSRIEAHDAAQAEFLVSSPGAADFEASRWLNIAKTIEMPSYQATIFETCRRYVRWLYWSDFLTPAIEVALAAMLELRMIEAADVWVLARALEDTLDLVLTKSRAEAELAALASDVERIYDLGSRLENATTTAEQFAISNVTCSIPNSSADDNENAQLRISNLRYDRGAARASADLIASPGEVFSLEGPNGSGKSTFFALLKTCAGGPPPQGMLDTSGAIILPSLPKASLYPSGIAHVPQRPYCPVTASPRAWLYSLLLTKNQENDTIAANILTELDFFHGSRDPAAVSTWLEEGGHEHSRDFCSELSGGQAVKVELARQIFIPVRAGAACPSVLLLDETFAPLDPRSKDIVQSALRSACPRTIILTIYHGDNNNVNGKPQEKEDACTESGGFFSDVLRFSAPTLPLAQSANSSYSSDSEESEVLLVGPKPPPAARFHLKRVGLCSS